MAGTGNPLGSMDILDQYENSKNLDLLVNGEEATYPDRFGKPRMSYLELERLTLGLSNHMSAGNTGSGLKKEIHLDLPLLFKDYDKVIAENPTLAYIYPGAFTMDPDGTIYITYGPNDGTVAKRWVVIYNKLGTYIGYLETDNGGSGNNGSVSSEGIVVLRKSQELLMYLCGVDGVICEYDITTPNYGGKMVRRTSFQVGIYNQFSHYNGDWFFEQAVPAVGQARGRNILSVYDSEFKLKGFVGTPISDSGYITSSTTEYGPSFLKRQGFCIGPDEIVMAYGGVYIEGNTAKAPTNYPGIRRLTKTGYKISESAVSPDGFIAKLKELGYPATRIENEGICFHSGKYYSLWIYNGRLDLSSKTSGILITREFSNLPTLDLTNKAITAPGYSQELLSSGVFPRIGQGDKLFNPITGKELSSIIEILDFIRLTGQRRLSIYTSSTGITDFNGAAYSGGVLLRIETLNNLTFELNVTTTSRTYNTRVVYDGLTYTQSSPLQFLTSRVAIDGVVSGNNVLNRVSGLAKGGVSELNSDQILMLDQQSGISNPLNIGGGSGIMRSASSIVFFTNPDPAALGGTARWKIDQSSLLPSSDAATNIGTALNRVDTFFLINAINTSDAREKTTPEQLTESLLDIGDEIGIVVFQWLKMVEEKGEEVARLHIGPIAQQIKECFDSRKLDGLRYGLLCYDKWGDKWIDEIIDVKDELTGEFKEVQTGNKIQVQWAGDRWSIRADQCLWLISAAKQRQLDRQNTRITELERKLDILISSKEV